MTVMRLAVTVLVTLLMPFQALTALYLDVLGPSHFHADSAGRHATRAEPAHGHRHVERHHHYPGQRDVVVVHHHAAPSASLPGEEPRAGWSAAMLATLVASAAVVGSPAMRDARASADAHAPLTPFLDRVEHPPRGIPV